MRCVAGKFYEVLRYDLVLNVEIYNKALDLKKKSRKYPDCTLMALKVMDLGQ